LANRKFDSWHIFRALHGRHGSSRWIVAFAFGFVADDLAFRVVADDWDGLLCVALL